MEPDMDSSLLNPAVPPFLRNLSLLHLLIACNLRIGGIQCSPLISILVGEAWNNPNVRTQSLQDRRTPCTQTHAIKLDGSTTYEWTSMALPRGNYNNNTHTRTRGQLWRDMWIFCLQRKNEKNIYLREGYRVRDTFSWGNPDFRSPSNILPGSHRCFEPLIRHWVSHFPPKLNSLENHKGQVCSSTCVVNGTTKISCAYVSKDGAMEMFANEAFASMYSGWLVPLARSSALLRVQLALLACFVRTCVIVIVVALRGFLRLAIICCCLSGRHPPIVWNMWNWLAFFASLGGEA